MRRQAATSAINDLGTAQELALARELLRVRLSMMWINDLIKKGTFQVPVHLALGHEAIAVAVSRVMQPGDRLVLTHRNIHYNLARGTDLEGEIAEYSLSERGIGGGRHGAMNLTQPSRGIVYTSSILANCLPVAVGIAKARELDEPRSVTLAVTGDGAIEEGAFYEALMLAASFRLPVVFLVENNEWSMYTRIHERRCSLDLRALAAAFDAPFSSLQGNDLGACFTGLAAVRRSALSRSAPCVVEVSLETLGDFELREAGRSPRHVNYHHGAVAWLRYEDDPVVDPSPRDPAWLLAQKLGTQRWTTLVSAARAEIARVAT